jgi:hypothetical protein
LGYEELRQAAKGCLMLLLQHRDLILRRSKNLQNAACDEAEMALQPLNGLLDGMGCLLLGGIGKFIRGNQSAHAAPRVT